MSMNEIPSRDDRLASLQASGSAIDARTKARAAATVAVLDQRGVATIAAPLGSLNAEAMRSDLGRLASTALAVPLSWVRWQAAATDGAASAVDDRELRAALSDAGKKLQRALIALATVTEGSPLQGFPAAALEAHDGAIRPRSGGSVSVGFGEILRLARKSEIRAQGEATATTAPSPALWGAHRPNARPFA